MIGFLERLVAANLGTIEDQVRPRLQSRFESPPQSPQLVVDGDAPHQVTLPTPATKAQRPRDLRPSVDERRLDDRIRAIAARQLSRPQRASTRSRDDEDAAVVRSRGSDRHAGQAHGVPPQREVAPQTPSPARAAQPARPPSPAEEAAVVVPATAVPARAASRVDPARSKPQGERHGREGPRRDRHSGRTGEREREGRREAREARSDAARQARDDVAGGEPTPVTITIGRIEVRVVPPQPAENPVRAPRQPSQSLDEYLTRRRDAGR